MIKSHPAQRSTKGGWLGPNFFHLASPKPIRGPVTPSNLRKPGAQWHAGTPHTVDSEEGPEIPAKVFPADSSLWSKCSTIPVSQHNELSRAPFRPRRFAALRYETHYEMHGKSIWQMHETLLGTFQGEPKAGDTMDLRDLERNKNREMKLQGI